MLGRLEEHGRGIHTCSHLFLFIKFLTAQLAAMETFAKLESTVNIFRARVLNLIIMTQFRSFWSVHVLN